MDLKTFPEDPHSSPTDSDLFYEQKKMGSPKYVPQEEAQPLLQKEVPQSNTRLYLTAATAVLSTFLFGYNTGNISGAMIPIAAQMKLTTFEQGLLVSVILISAAIGSTVAGTLVDTLGRKKTILWNNFFYVIGPVIMTLSPNYELLVIGRFITGLGVGIAIVVISLYLSEVAPATHRGSLGQMRQFSVTFGILVSYIVGYLVLPRTYVYGWRIVFACAIIPAVLQFILSALIPESPRWLVSRNLDAEARRVLKLMDVTLIKDTTKLNSIIEEIQLSLAESMASGGGTWGELLQKKYQRVLVISIALSIFQQVTGINTVIYYSPTIFYSAGFSRDDALLITFVVALPQLCTIFASIFLIERIRRRVMFIAGLSVMIVSLGVLGGGFFSVEELRSVIRGEHTTDVNRHLTGVFKWMAVFGVLFFRISFAMGLGPLPGTIQTEICPSRIRGKATAITSMVNWLSNFAVSLSFLPLLEALGTTITYWFYMLLAFFCLLFVIIMVPETKGVSLEELERRLIRE
eukprot:TRINITY_DN3955_c0_g2_i1.p1 TRINITY_DN3955_c0_g2~~TRINITY_DN3955_c0_g2_i1.p1  ORF type:complete len:518 (+),score=55.66 TRINITY_DN3955_c0_g2_i1:604-2157(+)